MKLSIPNTCRSAMPVVLLGLGSALSAQISLGTVEYSIDAQTNASYKVAGQVDFSYSGGNLTLTTQITNTGINRLSGLYILKPFDFGAAVDADNPFGYDFAGAPFGFSVAAIAGGEDQWELANTSQDSRHEFWRGFEDLVSDVDDTLITEAAARTIAANRTDFLDYYVGTEAQDYDTLFERRLQTGEGIEVAWSFVVGSLDNARDLVSNYTTSEWPLIFARWNELNESTLDKFNWAKGWTTGQIVVVPEPSAVGWMGFGLPLCLLVLRRRRPRKS